MGTQMDTQKIKEQLEIIAGNRLFNKSPRYINLITFLVEEALKGNDLKENVIGVEVFGEDYTSAKNDGLVRVYMYNLRKKLKTYYLEDGKDAPIVFVLEKGSYQIKFVDKADIKEQTNETVETPKPLKPKNKTYLISAIVLIIGVAIIGYYFSTKEKVYLWDSFFAPKASNICILADQVILHKKGSNSGELITNPEVNSTKEFINHIEKHAIDSLEKLGYTMYTKAIPHSVYKLSRWFFKHKAEFTSLAESEFRYEETKRNNILYIGQQKTMSVSKELFLRNSKVFKTEKNYFVSNKNGNKNVYRAGFGYNDVVYEYAMVSFMPLNNGNRAIYIVSNHDIGTMALVNNFTDPQFLKDFYKRLPAEGTFFNALFKVEGVERTDVDCELVELEIVQK